MRLLKKIKGSVKKCGVLSFELKTIVSFLLLSEEPEHLHIHLTKDRWPPWHPQWAWYLFSRLPATQGVCPPSVDRQPLSHHMNLWQAFIRVMHLHTLCLLRRLILVPNHGRPQCALVRVSKLLWQIFPYCFSHKISTSLIWMSKWSSTEFSSFESLKISGWWSLHLSTSYCESLYSGKRSLGSIKSTYWELTYITLL